MFNMSLNSYPVVLYSGLLYLNTKMYKYIYICMHVLNVRVCVCVCVCVCVRTPVPSTVGRNTQG